MKWLIFLADLAVAPHQEQWRMLAETKLQQADDLLKS